MSEYNYSTTAGSNTSIEGIGAAVGAMVPSNVGPLFRAMTAARKAMLLDSQGDLTTGGAATAYTLTTNAGITAYSDGMEFGFVAHASNTSTSPTLNVDSVGAKAIRISGDLAPNIGSILIKGHYTVRYDASANAAAGAWLIVGGTAYPTLTSLKFAGGAILTNTGNSLNFTSATSGYNFDDNIIGANHAGGTAAGSTLTLKSTTANGTTDAIIFGVGNNGATEAARIDHTGHVLIGTTATVTIGGIGANLQVINSGASTVSLGRWSADSAGAKISFAKSRNATIGSNTIVQNGDDVGSINWYVDDGTDFATPLAQIGAEVDGTPGVNDAPGRIVFSTTADGASTLTESMRITNNNNVKLGGTVSRATTEGTNHLDIFNGTAPVGTLANGVSLYSTAGELRVMDAAGNATLLSPHDHNTNEWVYDSVDTTTGKRLHIEMERMLKAINAQFGWDYIHETRETV